MLLVFDKPVFLVFLKGDPQLLLCIHNYGAVPRHRLTYRPSRYEQEPDWRGICLDRDFIAVIKEDKHSVAHKRLALNIEIVYPFDLVRKRVLLLAEISLTLNHVGENRVSLFCLMNELRLRRD